MLELLPNSGADLVESGQVGSALSAHDHDYQSICLLLWSMLYLRLGSTITHTPGLGRVCQHRLHGPQNTVRLLQ